MNKYHNGKIYKIVDVGYNKQYIGSTTESLSRRMSKHRYEYNKYKEGLRTKTSSADMFDEFGVENCKIELIEYCKSETKEELMRREGEHIKTNECLNKRIAGRTPDEFYQDNKERRLAESKEYRLKNIDAVRERKKHYYKQNKERLLTKFQEYNEAHKEDIKAQKSKKIVCGCGITHTFGHRAKHQRSNIHQEYLKSIEED